MSAAILRLPARKPTKRGHELATASGRTLRLVTEVQKDAPGMATDYSVRLAPGAIARIKLQRLTSDHFFIEWVFVPPGWREHGLGGQLMRRVLRDADAHGVRLTLEARACGETDQAALERWYQNLGFARAGRRGKLGPVFVRVAARSRAA